MEEYGLTQEQVADRMGKSRPAITNTLRLLALPEDLLKLVEEEQLSAGHARALLAPPRRSSSGRPPRRSLPTALCPPDGGTGQGPPAGKEGPRLSRRGTAWPSTSGRRKRISSGRVGRKVHIAHRGKKGRIELEYYNSQDLELLLEALERLNAGEVQGHGCIPRSRRRTPPRQAVLPRRSALASSGGAGSRWCSTSLSSLQRPLPCC